MVNQFRSFPTLSCTATKKKNEVKFECKSRSGHSHDHSGDQDTTDIQDRGITISPDDINDKIKYKVKTTNKGIKVQIEYKQKVETDDTETETKTDFELLFESLVEYVKGPNSAGSGSLEDEAYDWDQDEILQTIPLNNWNDISAIADDEDGIISYFSANTSAGAIGSATFNFTISRADQSEHITANSMKIDVLIVNFPWLRSNSYVALISTVESKRKVKMEYNDEATTMGPGPKHTEEVTISLAEGMDTVGFSAFGEYTWEDQAEAATSTGGPVNGTVTMARQGSDQDNNVIMVGTSEGDENNTLLVESTKSTIEVVATSPPNGNETFQRIAYSFVGEEAHEASEIYWDPEAGIGYESAAFTMSSLLSFVGSVAGAFLYLAL